MKKKIKWTQTVLIADGTLDTSKHKCHIEDVKVPRKVPVTVNFDNKKKLGTAKLKVCGNEVVANFTLKISHSFMLHNKIPAIQSWIRDVADDGTFEGMEVMSIGICVGPNSDRRIKRIQTDKFS